MKFLSAQLLVMTLLFAACSSDQKNPLTHYSDAEIGLIITTVNEGEIAMAQEIVNRGKNEEVREYAQEMINDHKSNNKKTKQIMVDADMDMDDDSLKSQTLASKAIAEKKQLERMKGKKIDKEYIEDQVETHKTVLKDLRETLIPQAENKELKAHLEETAKTIESHLEHAQQLERKLI